MTYIPFFLKEEKTASRWRITCDHAANTIPPSVNGGTLGLAASDMTRHIAYDIGAWGVAEALAEALGAPVVGANFSRLVIDPNRGEDDPTLLMKIYDGSIIPGNRHADDAERDRRLDLFYRPYDQAIARILAPGAPVVVSIHSFTPQLRGRPPRPWHIGVLHAGDTAFPGALITALRNEADLVVGENEPYAGHLPGDAIDRHALAGGIPNVLIELRNDLIAEPQGQKAWALRLAPLLQSALAASGV